MYSLVSYIAAAAAEIPKAAPVVDVMSSFYGTLLQNGLLGLALAFTIFLLIRRDKELQTSWQSRLDDAKSLADVIKTHSAAIQTSNVAEQERNRALEAAARAAERSAIVIDQLNKEIEILHQEIKAKGLKE